MRIARRDFLKMLGAFGGVLAAEGLAPSGIVKPTEIMLPDKPTVVGPMPRMGGGLSGFFEIDVGSMTITAENPRLVEFGVQPFPSFAFHDAGPRYFTIDLSIVADEVMMRQLDSWAATALHAKNAVLRIPQQQGEWLCIYCGSPQPMTRTHCSQCGAARDWVVT